LALRGIKFSGYLGGFLGVSVASAGGALLSSSSSGSDGDDDQDDHQADAYGKSGEGEEECPVSCHGETGCIGAWLDVQLGCSDVMDGRDLHVEEENGQRIAILG
jgi:hypothetical protein